MEATMPIKHVVVEGTRWPVDIIDGDQDSAEWVQRYGAPILLAEQRYSVASALSAYHHLIDPRRTQAEAIASLKRARKAAVIATNPIGHLVASNGGDDGRGTY
jgi:hypothetical protein